MISKGTNQKMFTILLNEREESEAHMIWGLSNVWAYTVHPLQVGLPIHPSRPYITPKLYASKVEKGSM